MLAEKEPTDPPVAQPANRRRLVRVLAAGQSVDEATLTQAESKLDVYENMVGKVASRHQRLNLHLRAVVGHYLVLLYPHRNGQSAPQTVWSQDYSCLSVSWSDQKDVFRFSKVAGERTCCELENQDTKPRSEHQP